MWLNRLYFSTKKISGNPVEENMNPFNEKMIPTINLTAKNMSWRRDRNSTLTHAPMTTTHTHTHTHTQFLGWPSITYSYPRISVSSFLFTIKFGPSWHWRMPVYPGRKKVEHHMVEIAFNWKQLDSFQPWDERWEMRMRGERWEGVARKPHTGWGFISTCTSSNSNCK